MMNRLRGDRVIVDLTEFNTQKKEDYKEIGSGIYIPDDQPKEAMLTKGIAVKVGHEIHPNDIREGQVVYVKKSQGERLNDVDHLYLYQERGIHGTD